MSVDKEYCMSAYMALRYIEDDNKDFFEGIHHKNFAPIPEADRVLVHCAEDIDHGIETQLSNLRNERLGILLSGGMDSAILASYMRGCDAYTFRFLGGEFHKEELERAEYYANCYGLTLHYVDIHWEVVVRNLERLIRAKAAPVHSIEPQIMQAALQAQGDGIQRMIVGASSDLVFGGMDGLLSQDWSFDGFMKRYIFTPPEAVLKKPASMQYLFQRYGTGEQIDFLRFLEDVALIECSGSYWNACTTANMPYLDPYVCMKMAVPLDLQRVRHGASKYLIRELFSTKYPDIPVPEKTPMPRPVDAYFADWQGPTRSEFMKNLNMAQFTGNQKWQMWCLEQFLNLYEP